MSLPRPSPRGFGRDGLLQCDPDRSEHEMAEVAVAAREALGEVRSAVTGMVNRSLDTLAWVLCLTWWGNIVAAAYILVALRQSEGDPARFFLGARAGLLRPVWTPPFALRLVALAGSACTAVFTGYKIGILGTIASSGHVHKCPEKSPKSKVFDGIDTDKPPELGGGVSLFTGHFA